MTHEEAKKAYFSGTPVLYASTWDGIIRCECITALIYRKKDSKQIVQAELRERGGKGVIVANIEKIFFEKENAK